MVYLFLADLIVVLHLAFLAFVILGQLAIVVGAVARQSWARNFWLRGVHFLAIGIVVFETVMSWECPLTAWERDLRSAGGQAVSNATFVGRLVHQLVFPCNDVPAEAFAPVYYTFGAIVAGTFLLAPPRWPRRRKRTANIPPGASRPPRPVPVPVPALPEPDELSGAPTV